MNYCANCGQALQAGATFCSKCGVPVVSTQPAGFDRRELMRGAMQVETLNRLVGLGGLIGLVVGGLGWLWLLYEPMAVNGDMGLVWFLGAFIAAFVGGLAGRYLTMALLAR
jgi:hypothetical protein